MLPYSVLLRVGFTVPRGVVPARGALLPHPFTLACARRPSAVCSLLHWPSVHTAQALPGTLPCGARTFLDARKAHRDCPADSAGHCRTGSTERGIANREKHRRKARSSPWIRHIEHEGPAPPSDPRVETH